MIQDLTVTNDSGEQYELNKNLVFQQQTIEQAKDIKAIISQIEITSQMPNSTFLPIIIESLVK